MDINQLLKFNIFVLETQEKQRHTHLAELLMEIWAPKKQVIQSLPEQSLAHTCDGPGLIPNSCDGPGVIPNSPTSFPQIFRGK